MLFLGFLYLDFFLGIEHPRYFVENYSREKRQIHIVLNRIRVRNWNGPVRSYNRPLDGSDTI
jgi:hypothetical protein